MFQSQIYFILISFILLQLIFGYQEHDSINDIPDRFDEKFPTPSIRGTRRIDDLQSPTSFLASQQKNTIEGGEKPTNSDEDKEMIFIAPSVPGNVEENFVAPSVPNDVGNVPITDIESTPVPTLIPTQIQIIDNEKQHEIVEINSFADEESIEISSNFLYYSVNVAIVAAVGIYLHKRNSYYNVARSVELHKYSPVERGDRLNINQTDTISTPSKNPLTHAASNKNKGVL